MKKLISSSVLFLFVVIGFMGCQNDSVTDPNSEFVTNDAPKQKMSIPSMTSYSSSQTSLDITVTAGPTGMPAGFSLQWMTAEDYAISGWSSSAAGYCHASFSGNANNSNYNLGAGQSVTIRIGDILFDNGVSSSCAEDLICGTQYVFRIFAHANNSFQRSDFSGNATYETASCESGSGCTFSQGYWKNHPEEWPVNNLTLGNISYTQGELISILQTPPAGNGILSLAHQLIAVKLSIVYGADPASIATSVASADAMIGDLVVPPVGTGTLASTNTSSLVTLLNNYIIGNHCP